MAGSDATAQAALPVDFASRLRQTQLCDLGLPPSARSRLSNKKPGILGRGEESRKGEQKARRASTSMCCPTGIAEQAPCA